ncbi:MAG: hypothetical protein ACRDTE_18960 [Pseudonocardiaceae bacterium]
MSALTAARAIEVTDPSGCTHLVAEERFTAGRRSGHYVSMCGAPVVSASLTVKEHELCSLCVERATND